MALTGLLLAGGRSTRMGLDKASMDFAGEPMAARALRVLTEIADDVLIASGDGARLAWLGYPQVADEIPDAGPMGGLVAGLERATSEPVAVIAVDMPYASAHLLRLLASMWDGEEAIVPVSDRGLEPLHAIYAKAAAPKLREGLDVGERSLHRALRGLRIREVGADEWRSADPTGRFAVNLNRPDDVQSSVDTGSTS